MTTESAAQLLCGTCRQNVGNAPALGVESVQRFWAEEAHNIRCVRESDFDERIARFQAEIEGLRSALKFYAYREHYHFESGNWDTVSGEPLNILWNGEEPDFIEDGTIAREALGVGKCCVPTVEELTSQASRNCEKPAQDIAARLAKVADGSIPHIFNGMCPDAIEGHDSRDPDCPACQLLILSGQQ